MQKSEIQLQLEKLKSENRRLKSVIQTTMTAGLIEAFAYENSFDLERSDFMLLTGVKFNSDCFFTVFFRERRSNGRVLQLDKSTMTTTPQSACSFEDMKRIITNAFQDQHTLLITPSHGHILAIINYSLMPNSTDREAIQDIEFTAREINLQMQEAFGFSFDIFISAPHFDVKNVCKATRDCELVQDYSLLLEHTDEPQILCYSWFRQIGCKGAEANITVENLNFGRTINNKDYAAARQILNESILPRLQNQRNRSLTLRLEYQRLTDFFIRTVLDESDFPQEMVRFHIEALLRAETYAELSAQMNRILNEAEHRASIRKNSGQLTAEQIHDYVSRFFSDESVDVTCIAAHFNVSASYISKVHRAAYGETVLTWLQTCRLLAADELLRSGASVRECAEKCGFGTASNYIRIHKKFYGSTPGSSR